MDEGFVLVFVDQLSEGEVYAKFEQFQVDVSDDVLALYALLEQVQLGDNLLWGVLLPALHHFHDTFQDRCVDELSMGGGFVDLLAMLSEQLVEELNHLVVWWHQFGEVLAQWTYRMRCRVD